MDIHFKYKYDDLFNPTLKALKILGGSGATSEIEEQVIDKAMLSKYIKSLIKYEFPRSRKVRMYQVDGPLELEKVRKKL